MTCLEYAGPTHAGRPVMDPDSDEYLWARTDWDAPALVHLAPTPPPPRPPRSPLTIRLRPSNLPPLPRWPLDDAPGRLNFAKARRAKELLAAGYSKSEIARAMGVSRASLTGLAHARSWRNVPWPPGYGPCRPGCSQVRRPAETGGSGC